MPKSKIVKIIQITILIWFIFAATINVYGILQRPNHSQVGIVLGNKVLSKTKPSHRLAARLDHAITLYKQGIIQEILVSGGTGKEGLDEAKVMARYLKSNGISSKSIMIDSLGNNTHQSSINALKLISKDTSVVGISQNFHLWRVKISLKNAGFQIVSVSCPKYFEIRDIYASFRETFAIFKYSIMGY